MIAVNSLSENVFPIEFLNTLPKVCETCGADTEITETLSVLVCSNKHCLDKSVQRLTTMLQDLGVKNMGESRCKSFLENFNTLNPYAIFAYEPSDGALFEGCSLDFSEGVYEQLANVKKMMLYDYIKVGNLPGIRDSAIKLFGNYPTLEAFFDDLELEGIPLVQDLLGIKVDSDNELEVASIKAIQVYKTLIDFKDELLEFIDFVDIENKDVPVLNICISTSVGDPFRSKADFVIKMNEKYQDKVHLNFIKSVTKACDFLIWSKEGGKTLKVSKAENYSIPIMTGLEFEDYLESI